VTAPGSPYHNLPTPSPLMPVFDLTEFRSRLLHWFQRRQRDLPWRSTSDPYSIWVSEVMLQQTQVKTVIPYYRRFVNRFPDVSTLAAAGQKELMKLWEGLGYYARARNLQRAARIVVAEFNGKVPDDYRTFRALPGVGDYIAAAVLSIAFGKPLATVDGNVKRVLARLLEMREPVNDPKSKASYQVQADRLLAADSPGDFNQAMMELGALVCTPRSPDCAVCPVSLFCLAFRAGTTAAFPRRLEKKPVPVYRIAVGVVVKRNTFLITLRQAEGLLGGLWEFPGGKVEGEETPARACTREIREETALEVEIADTLAVIHHAYTHFRIRMTVFVCRYRSGRVSLNGPAAHRWIRFSQIDRFPFPKANHKVFPKLQAYLEKRCCDTRA